jgi:hypothetical protein
MRLAFGFLVTLLGLGGALAPAMAQTGSTVTVPAGVDTIAHLRRPFFARYLAMMNGSTR